MKSPLRAGSSIEKDSAFDVSNRMLRMVPGAKNSFEHEGEHTSSPRNVERGLRVRIATGFGIILTLTLVVGVWSYIAIADLGSSAETVFVANYRSIQYAHGMERIAEAMSHPAAATDIAVYQHEFDSILTLEANNITEPGEAVISHSIRSTFAEYSSGVAAHHDAATSRAALDDAIESLRLLNERSMFARAEQVRDQARLARVSTAGISIAMLALATLLAIAVSRRSLAEYRMLDAAKSNFLAIAAHELKTPLASIKTSAGLLLDGVVGGLTEAQANIVSMTHREAERMLSLVRDLLDLARLETGMLPIVREEVDCESILESAVTAVSMQAAVADVTVKLEGHQATTLIGDANKLSWAVANLLANAIRYSPRGATVTLHAERTMHEVVISVADHGSGIPAQHLKRIFEKFAQVENSRMGPIQGSGLGLSIAREVVHAHGGRIWAESTPGEGSTFRLALPLVSTRPVA